MKWIGISGTWRTTDAKVEQDVRAAVREIIARGDGIIDGGATGVDFFATDEALKCAPDGSRVKVVIPSTLENYIIHLQSWSQGYDTGDPSVSPQAVSALVDQLMKLSALEPSPLVEGPDVPALDIRQMHYDARDTAEAEMMDELLAFQINKSPGTQDTIDKTRVRGKAVTVKFYTVAVDSAYGAVKASKPSL